MTLGSYAHPKFQRQRSKELLETARANLRKFRLLFSFAKGLAGLTRVAPKNNMNVLFWMAERGDSLRLRELARGIRELKFAALPDALRANIASSLNSRREEKSISAISEIHTAYSLAKRFGKGRVRIYPTYPRRGPDLEVIVHTRPVYFEVTAIGSGKTEEKLRKICQGISKGLHTRIRGRRYLRLEVSSEKLRKNKKGHFLVKPSIDVVLSSFDQLNLPWLAKRNGTFNLSEIAEQASYRHLSLQVRRLANQGSPRFYRSSAFQRYLEPLDEEKLRATPIIHMACYKFAYRVAETACEMSFPSKASEGEQGGFLDRIEKRILAKIQSGQLKAGCPNVLVVNATNWTLRYDLAHARWEAQFDRLKKRLRLVLAEWRPRNLSAIMMYENDIRDARIVCNRFASPDSRLSGDEVMSLGKRVAGRAKREREATRLRKRVIHSKLESMKQSVTQGYERSSTISQLATITPYSSSALVSGSGLKQIGIKIGIEKDEFKDPTRGLDFSAFGQEIANREIRHLISSIIRASVDAGPWTVTSWKTLSDTVEKFNSSRAKPTALFVPFREYLRMLDWPKKTRRYLTFDGSRPVFVTTRGTQVPIYRQTGRHGNVGFILYGKAHGEWIVKPGNVSARLSILVSMREKVMLTAYTEAGYRTDNKAASLLFQVQESSS